MTSSLIAYQLMPRDPRGENLAHDGCRRGAGFQKKLSRLGRFFIMLLNAAMPMSALILTVSALVRTAGTQQA
jgi:hypothetical protein